MDYLQYPSQIGHTVQDADYLARPAAVKPSVFLLMLVRWVKPKTTITRPVVTDAATRAMLVLSGDLCPCVMH